MPFDEDMAESMKVGELKEDCFYWYILFIIHTSYIEKGLIHATFLQGLRHNKWIVIPCFV